MRLTMPDDKRKVLVVGSGDSALLAKLGKLLADADFEVWGEDLKDRRNPTAGDRDILLSSMPVADELNSETYRKPKPVEPWRVKKGRFKGDFPRYR